MKNGKSLTELAMEIERQAAAKIDYLVPEPALTMTEDSQLQFQNGSLQTMPASDHTHGQIATHLKIPKTYYDRLRTESPELLAQNVNTWLGRSKVKRMVRTLDGRARAYVSDSFSRGLDNIDAAKALIPLLQESGAMVRSSEITERSLYIKAVLPTMEREVKRGDAVRWGIILRNSEIGLGALVVNPFVERLVCTNGMVVEDGKFKARHLGRRSEGGGEDYAHLLASDTIAAEDKAIALRLRDVVKATLTDEFFQRYIGKMQAAAGEKVENVVQAVEVLAKTYNLNESEQAGVLQRMIEGADLSRYGLLNAVTNLAESAGTYDRATELEVLGGTILDLPASDWKVLAQAA